VFGVVTGLIVAVTLAEIFSFLGKFKLWLDADDEEEGEEKS
jgi:hypothetical protein